MAAENHAGYGRIGFTVFIGALALAVALIYIAGVGGGADELLVETYYDHPVSGLSVGSSVNFRGVKVGEVREIDFAQAVYPEARSSSADFQRIVIVMALDSRKTGASPDYDVESILQKYLRAGIRATIATNPVTGMSRVEFNIVKNAGFPPQTVWTPRYPLIPPEPSLMENMSDSISRVLHEFNQTDFGAVWSNIASIAASSAKVTKEVGELVTEERRNVSSILRNLESASSAFDELAERLRTNPSLLLREHDPEPLPETR